MACSCAPLSKVDCFLRVRVLFRRYLGKTIYQGLSEAMGASVVGYMRGQGIMGLSRRLSGCHDSKLFPCLSLPAARRALVIHNLEAELYAWLIARSYKAIQLEPPRSLAIQIGGARFIAHQIGSDHPASTWRARQLGNISTLELLCQQNTEEQLTYHLVFNCYKGLERTAFALVRALHSIGFWFNDGIISSW